eukprot:gb/GECH01012753.1/.p1 GENE.gb/GECH01012753.1/~~gb/GECH01012753.1/.p1  ORF type:complete len:727 (+),score=126.92 gb/GECH01012753.1/:1-2181(+)
MNISLKYIPPVIVTGIALSMITSVTLSMSLGHKDSYLPTLSETGIQAPERYFFMGPLVIASVVFAFGSVALHSFYNNNFASDLHSTANLVEVYSSAHTHSFNLTQNNNNINNQNNINHSNNSFHNNNNNNHSNNNSPSHQEKTEQDQTFAQLPINVQRMMKHLRIGFKSHQPHDETRARASNNWVVSGSMTASGKPILCNDPHMGTSAPMLWYIAHLHVPGALDVAGATLPGLPGVVIGRNEHISWGITNVGADVQDLFIMQETANGTKYIHGNGTRDYDISEETIKVKGASSETIQVRRSIYGPVINDVIPDFTDEERHALPPLCFSWVPAMPGIHDITMEAFWGLMVAENWNDFSQALSKLTSPSQNFIYSDVNNNIGLYIPGKMPLRRLGHTGKYPVLGNGDFDWLGYIPFEELPFVLNPKDRSYLASANNAGVPETYAHVITKDWSPGYRAQRITQVLQHLEDNNTSVDVDVMRSLQQDQVTLQWEDMKYLVKQMNQSLDNLQLQDSDKQREWIGKLMEWDGNEARSLDTQVATVYEGWVQELSRVAFQETNLTHWGNPIFLRSRFQESKCPGDRSCVQYAADALMNALNRLPSSIPGWGHGIHEVQFKHEVLSETPLACITDRSRYFGGDRYTVNVGPYSDVSNGEDDNFDFVMDWAPSYRQILDMNNNTNSCFIVPMGQSGHVTSHRYDNWLDLWLNGDYLPLYMNGYDAKDVSTFKPKS